VIQSKPHIVFINQHYWPDNAATALVLTDLAEEVSKHDYRVSVICSPYLYDYSGKALPHFEQRNGVDIYRVKQTNYGRLHTKGRLKDYASFFWGALKKSFELKPDIIVTLTTPPLVGSIGWLHTLTRSCRFIYWCMDLHPEAEIATGLIRPNSGLEKVLTSLHGKILASATAVVSLSPAMKSRILAYPVIKNAVRTISIWSDENEFITRETEKVSTNQSALPEWFHNRFIVHYSGNLGLAHTWKPFFEAMNQLKDSDEIGFLFTGGGPQMPTLQQHCEQSGLHNVWFRPYVERSDLAESLSLGHITWLSLKVEFEGIAYPSKLIGYMAAAKPVVFIGHSISDTAELIQQAECGFAFTPNQTSELVSLFRSLSKDSRKLNEMGKRGQRYFLEFLNRSHLSKKWLELLSEMQYVG
jgi:glycosyltransferase involved in cell wall biosynthesis